MSSAVPRPSTFLLRGLTEIRQSLLTTAARKSKKGPFFTSYFFIFSSGVCCRFRFGPYLPLPVSREGLPLLHLGPRYCNDSVGFGTVFCCRRGSRLKRTSSSRHLFRGCVGLFLYWTMRVELSSLSLNP